MRLYPLILLLCISFSGMAQIRLPRLVSDGMVLQRETEVSIWGWAGAGEEVGLCFAGGVYRTEADGAGNWKVTLPAMPAGGPYKLVLSGRDTITVNDILIGDVWVCSGQSNMETTMERVSPLYPGEIESAGNSFIRYFTVPKTFNFNAPQQDLKSGSWISPGPDNILQFSAVAYFYAKALYDSIRVPIGLINASLGGSPAEAWIDEQTLTKFPEYHREVLRFKDTALIDSIRQADQIRTQSWYDRLRAKDRGYADPLGPWKGPAGDRAGWRRMRVPGYWADTPLGEVNGVVWFRNEIQLPAAIAGTPARLLLGRIVDADSVFVNGVFVGATGYQYPPRRYIVPPQVLKEGKNTLVVRVISNLGRGGFVCDKPYQLVIGERIIDLEGKWQYRLAVAMEPLAPQTFVQWKPAGLYNAMIAPLQTFPIKGVVWYQGESNTSRPAEYRDLFRCLIQSWRAQWGQGEFPFLFVQLPNYMEPRDQPSESNWAELRESQMKALVLPNTGMAVAIDLGEWNDIHPLNKKDVSERLVRAALKVAYGRDAVVHSGPMLESREIHGNSVLLTFSDVGKGLVVKGGGKLKQFAVAGKDGRFVRANAKITGPNRVIVSSDAVPHPVAVRYAWADNPEGANLYNSEGLPAAPFRTDH